MSAQKLDSPIGSLANGDKKTCGFSPSSFLLGHILLGPLRQPLALTRSREAGAGGLQGLGSGAPGVPGAQLRREPGAEKRRSRRPVGLEAVFRGRFQKRAQGAGFQGPQGPREDPLKWPHVPFFVVFVLLLSCFFFCKIIGRKWGTRGCFSIPRTHSVGGCPVGFSSPSKKGTPILRNTHILGARQQNGAMFFVFGCPLKLPKKGYWEPSKKDRPLSRCGSGF